MDNPRADHDGVPLHTLVMAMDSALLHGRSLYEFFGLIPDKRPDNETKLATIADIGVTASFQSPWLETWGWALNARRSTRAPTGETSASPSWSTA